MLRALKKKMDRAELRVQDVYFARKYNAIVNARLNGTKDPLTREQTHAFKTYWNTHWRPGRANVKWAQFYYLNNGIFSPCYVPSDIYFSRIIYKLNRRAEISHTSLADKNYLDLLFPDAVKPYVLIRNINGTNLDHEYKPVAPAAVADICTGNGEIVIKPTIDSGHARNVAFLSEPDIRTRLPEIIGSYKKDFVIQRSLKQHPLLARLNSDSINTIRILSLLWNDEVQIIGSLIRIGVPGILVDNLVASYGVACGIGPDGKLLKHGHDHDCKPVAQLGNGIVLDGYPIPSFDRIIDFVKKNHFRLPHFRMIGWDITVNEEGEPVLIESNLRSPEMIDYIQLDKGPLFGEGELLDQILAYVKA